jgi:hypothetical protein
MEKIKITEADVQKKLNLLLRNSTNIIIPNLTFWNREYDLVLITKANILTVFEIKTSYADFRNNAKKKVQVDYSTYYREKEDKYQINYFYYVIPECVYEKVKEEIPDKYGIYTFSENILDGYSWKTFTNNRVAKKLTDKKINDLCLRNLYYRTSLKYWNLKK